VPISRKFLAAAVAAACALGFGAASLTGGTHQAAAHRSGAADRMTLTAALGQATATPGDPIYMNYSGVPGEVTATGHLKWIQVDSYHLGFSATPLPAGRPGVRAQMGSFTVTTPYSTAIPLLLKQLVSGKHAPVVTVHAVKLGDNGAPQTYLSFKLNNVFVSSIQENSSGERPEETLVLQAAALSVKYIAPDGSSFAFCFNFARGKGC
jgi:type VI secretion system secreted protein Hcp